MVGSVPWRQRKPEEARPKTSEGPDRTSIEDFTIGISHSSIFHCKKLPEHLLLSQTSLEIQQWRRGPFLSLKWWISRGSEHASPEYATLAWGLFWAEGKWETADTGGAALNLHKSRASISFCKGSWSPPCEVVHWSYTRRRINNLSPGTKMTLRWVGVNTLY